MRPSKCWKFSQQLEKCLASFLPRISCVDSKAIKIWGRKSVKSRQNANGKVVHYSPSALDTAHKCVVTWSSHGQFDVQPEQRCVHRGELRKFSLWRQPDEKNYPEVAATCRPPYAKHFFDSGSEGTPSAITIGGFFVRHSKARKKVVAKTKSNCGEIQGPPWLTVTMRWADKSRPIAKMNTKRFSESIEPNKQMGQEKSINMACWEDVENRKKLCGWEKAREMQFIDAYVRSDIFFHPHLSLSQQRPKAESKIHFQASLWCISLIAFDVILFIYY